MRVVTELYGAGLARIIEVVGAEAPSVRRRPGGRRPGRQPARRARSPSRRRSARGCRRRSTSVRPFLAGHGGDVELLDIDEAAGAVHLRLLGSCDGCPSSAVTLQHAVERAIIEAAPEIEIIDVEAPTDTRPTTPSPRR